ncbi:tetratricopeptide repeat protein [Glycomyces paridis]|uniref:Tetratricopeptide repeat protein n=1 Tax=Glycomyces paridis TaxID=2126555 RepID=A0A4V6T6A0_9ACTN|nr:tetratricopeptide repeat protein [Glycomyces paridis]THV25906.1 hypothetical protein E9998_19400 [Glycomyces paridis]
MPSERLRTLRELSLYRKAWNHFEHAEPGDDEARFQFLRLCRDTDRRKDAERLQVPEDATSELVGEELTLLGHFGDVERIRSTLGVARRRIDAEPERELDFGDCHLVCSVARAEAALGNVRAALGTVARIGSRARADVRAEAPDFTTRVFLLQRMGWVGDIRRLIAELGDLHRGHADRDAGVRRLQRLVVAGRALASMGENEHGLEHLRRAVDLSIELADTRDERTDTAGVVFPLPWRWLAHGLRVNGYPDEAVDLFARAADVPLWSGPDSPVPGLSVAASPVMRLERIFARLWGYDGGDDERFAGLLDEVAAITSEHGGSAELTWTRAQILHRLNRADELRRLAESNRVNLFPKIEYARLLSERGHGARADTVIQDVLERQPTHREALLLSVYIEANRPRADLDTAGFPRTDTLRGRLAEDAAMLALAAERLAQNGHFAPAERLFSHLAADNPAYGLGWAGRIRAAAWNHDWPLLADVEAQFEAAAVSGEDRSLGAPARPPAMRATVARALAKANQFDYDAASSLLSEASDLVASGDDPTATEEEQVQVRIWQVEVLRWQERPMQAKAMCEGLAEGFPRNAELIAKHGWALLDCQEFAAAEERFREALRLGPEEASAWRGLIHALVSQLRHEEALACAARARTVMHNSAATLCETAWIHHLVHRLDLAVLTLDEALEAAPNHPTALAWKAVYLSDLRDHAAAIEAAEQGRRLRPDSVEVWQALCLALLRRGEADRALDVAEEARTRFSGHDHHDMEIELMAAGVYAQAGADEPRCDPLVQHLSSFTGVPDAIRTASSILRHHQRLDEAKALVETAPTWRSSPMLLHEHAESACAAGKFHEADLDLARALQLNPRSMTVYSRQVQLWIAQQRFDPATALLERARRLLPGHFGLDILWGEVLLESGQAERALAVCATQAARFGRPEHQSVRLRIVRIRATRATGAVHEALAQAELLRTIVPSSRRGRLTLARSLEDVDKAANGIALLEPTLRELPLYPPCPENAALFCRFQDDHVRAHDVLEQAMGHYKTAPDADLSSVRRRADAGLLAEQALTFVAQGDLGQAEAILDTLGVRPDVHANALGHICRGWYRLSADEPERAAEEFRNAVATGICLSEARFGLAYSQMRMADSEPDPKRRRVHLRAALALAESHRVGSDFERTRILAGNAAYQLSDWVRAERHFRASITMHPVHGGYVELAMVLNQQGRFDEALREIDKAVRHGRSSARLLAVRGLTRLRMAVERRASPAIMEAAARDINRALDREPTDPTVLSAVVYAANHTDLYEPTEVIALLREARRVEANRRSVTVMAVLRLMTAEMMLWRLSGRLWHGSAYWAKRSLRTAQHPRAWAIAKSRRHRRSVRLSLRNRPHQGENGAADARSMRERRVTARILLVLGVLTLVAPAAVGLGSGPAAAFSIPLLLPGAILLVAGMFMTRLGVVRLGGVEFHVAGPSALDDPIQLPTTLPVQAPMTPQTIAAQLHTNWLPQPRFQLLGPAVGPMITGHYAYRDAYFPWRTR